MVSTTFLAILSSALLGLTSALPQSSVARRDVCGTCNPISGQNFCDITTSCISTGTEFHCACRAGYKASEDNGNVSEQFRLEMPNYEFLVFVPEYTSCNTLCDNTDGFNPQLCAEVPIEPTCQV